jgi:UDP-glucose-4-epimerase GalE
VWALVDAKRPVVVFDDLSTGHRELLPPGVPLVVGDVRDVSALRACFAKYDVASVVHCAALALVGESVANPGRYWSVNVGGTGALVEVSMAAGVGAIVFSSSAATYGEPGQIPIPESHPMSPINPYGRTKMAAEAVLRDAEEAGGPQWLALRYFNAAGADSRGRCGEQHEPETHIIPNILAAALSLQRGEHGEGGVTLFGDDYPTRDGTCVRDYVHTMDIAAAHLHGLEYLSAGGESGAFNLGTGRGVTLRELLDVASAVTGVEIPVKTGPRRPGDPARLVADPTRAWQTFGWRARHSEIDEIVRTAWDWCCR